MLNPVYNDDFLMHHGVKGMKWGIRRYQNPDGTLTDLGRKRLAKSIQSLGDKKQDSFEIASKANKKLNLKKNLIISKEKKAAIQKALDEWYEKDEALDKLWTKIAVEKSAQVDEAMKNAGVDPNDRHRGYWEEEVIINDSRYKALKKEVDSLSDKYRSMEREVANSFIKEYGNLPVESSSYWAKDKTVESIITNALFYDD